jgi:ABC-type hemin transport system substrate-binding protein
MVLRQIGMKARAMARLPLDRIVVEHHITGQNVFKVLASAYVRQYNLRHEDSLFRTANTLREVGALSGRKRNNKTAYSITDYGKALYNQALRYQ